MKILICPDKFKGSLNADQVCQAIAKGLNRRNNKHEVISHPMADGGDGSLEILSSHMRLKQQLVETTDPLGRKISARYFTSSNEAFIEMATASGLVLLHKDECNPMLTTTYGTGTMIAHAFENGFKNIYLFLGGSATNDGGMGIANALGYQFLDQNGAPLQPIGSNLAKVKRIEKGGLYDLNNLNMFLLCDVTNPLFGPNGAAFVYARQKGATEAQVENLDRGLRHFSKVLREDSGVNVSSLQGGGAAGGIGASLVALFGAKIENGFDALSHLTGLDRKIQVAEWVISGEGQLDSQSLQGKVINGVANLCKKYSKPFSLFVGKNELNQDEIDNLGVREVAAISDLAPDLSDAMLGGAKYLEDMAFHWSLLLSSKDG